MLMNFHRQQYERFNVVSKSLRLIRNILFLIIFGYLGIMIFLTVIEDGKANFVMSSYLQEKANYVQVLARPTSLNALNADGTMNGLNLALISQLSDGYIKEYLTLAADNQQGKLNTNSKHMSVDGIIALNMAEQGPYEGTCLPCSYLPFENGKVVWKESRGGLPAEALTLSKANKNVIGGQLGSGPVQPYSAADDVAWGDTANGGTASPFQIGLNWIKTITPSTMNGYNVSSGREPDILYFPDELTYLDMVSSKIISNYFNIDELDSIDGATLGTMFFAAGEGNACHMEFAGIGYGTDDNSKAQRLESWKAYKESMSKVDAKYGSTLAKYSVDSGEFHQVLTTAMTIAAVEQGGWKFEDDSKISELLSNGFTSYQILHPGSSQSEFESFVNSNKGSSGGFYISRTSWCHIYKITGQFQNNSDNISFGHTFMCMYLGKYYYAYMLQMGGLSGVDPTNPSTYMVMQKSNGQWTPEGNTDWMKEAQIDMSKLNDKRAQTLQYGHTWLHLRYISERPYVWPEFNADGTINTDSGVIDCSAFVICIIKKITGVDVGGGPDGSGNTDTILANTSACREVPPSEMKPGDLIVMGHGSRTGTAHVVMYLSGNCDRETTTGFWYMDTGGNDSGGVKVTGTGWAWQKQDRSTWYYLHVNAYGD